MSYCLNPNCQQPQNLKDAIYCHTCQSNLLLQECYRAIKPIGSGSFGRTFLAVDESSNEKTCCVIKQFFPHNGNNNCKSAQLFSEEAARLKQVGNHPQIPKLLDYFEQDNRQYLVQEFVNGRNLAEELADRGTFDETQIIDLLYSLLRVLRFIHFHQLIHRDIKPENIIVRHNNGQLVLVDFGASKVLTGTAIARTGTTIGSAAYMAPEQTRGKATFASDIYSLGVTCIHLLTQMSPFDLFDTNEGTWIWRDFVTNPVSDRLGRILDKMLQNATKLRYQSASEVIADLNVETKSANAAIPAIKFKPKWLLGGTILLLGFASYGYLKFSNWQPVAVQNQPEVIQEFDRQTIQKQGGLYVETEDGKQQAFPLKHTEVTARIAGNVSRVEVTQTFTNPFKEGLEAIYVFPLPDEAAVDSMEIRIGDRIIKGTIKQRQQAKQIYQQAKREGKTAALLEQERDNVFTQSLANIKPGEQIDVTIRYTDSLKFEKGNYEFVLPMVVGPRYIPGTSIDNQGNTNLVPDAERINPPTFSGIPPSNQPRPNIGVTVEINAGVSIQNLRSPSHQLQVQKFGEIVQVQLANQTVIPNKDLVLRYQVSSTETQSTVLTQADERGGHFAAYLIPALHYPSDEIVPKDVVFLMDTSGSQAGAPLEQSKALMRRFINGLNPNDTFSIVDFSSTTTQLSPEPLSNTKTNRNLAIAYINRLQANGGTELLNGIEKVLSFPVPESGRLRSIVLITDGLIGNESEIIAEVQRRLQPGNRLYSFGVGSSVNRFLLNRLSEVGRGTVQVVNPNDSTQKVTEKFFQQLNNPVLTNIQISWQGLGKKPEIYPLASPDLFANQPLVLFGRKQDRLSGTLRISGMAAGGKPYQQSYQINFGVDGSGNRAIAQLWGRAKIKDLTTQMSAGETASGIAAVTNTALAYQLMSKYTAFVAVTEEVQVQPNGKQRRVKVPVAKPEGMDVNQQSHSDANTRIPEPSLVWAILLLGLYLGWKQWTSKINYL